MNRESFTGDEICYTGNRTRKTISKIYDYLNLGEQPRQEELCLAERGNYAQFAAGMTSLKDKSFNSYKIDIKKIK